MNGGSDVVVSTGNTCFDGNHCLENKSKQNLLERLKNHSHKEKNFLFPRVRAPRGVCGMEMGHFSPIEMETKKKQTVICIKYTVTKSV